LVYLASKGAGSGAFQGKFFMSISLECDL